MIRKAIEIIGIIDNGENVLYKLECGHRGSTLNDWHTGPEDGLDGGYEFECMDCDDEGRHDPQSIWNNSFTAQSV